MESFFKKMNREERRAFDKLPKEKQFEFFAQEVTRTQSKTIEKHITNAFFKGHINAHTLLYNQYVKPIIEEENIAPERFAELAQGCFAEIIGTIKNSQELADKMAQGVVDGYIEEQENKENEVKE